MRRSTYESMNVILDQILYAKDFIESSGAQEKLEASVQKLKALVNEDYTMGSTNRRTCKTVRTNFVKNNPALLDAAQKIIEQPTGTPLLITGLFDDKYLRVVITFVKDKLPDFRYFTYNVGEDRMLVKVSGAQNDNGETFEPTF